MPAASLLIIDDEPAIAALIGRAGQASGYGVVEAADAEAFKKQVLTSHPDVICIDLGMPAFDGVEVLRFLAAENCRSKILIISGFDQQMISTALRLGEAMGLHMAGTIAKPIGIARLKQLLSDLAAEGPSAPAG